MPNVKFLESMSVLMLFKQIVGRIFNTDDFSSWDSLLYSWQKTPKLHHEGDTRIRESYGEKDQIILCPI